jgi:hypothetical protein
LIQAIIISTIKAASHPCASFTEHHPVIHNRTVNINPQYTVNFKKVEIAIKRIIHGQEVDNIEALNNPE